MFLRIIHIDTWALFCLFLIMYVVSYCLYISQISICSPRINKYFAVFACFLFLFFWLGHFKVANIMISSLQYTSLKNDIFSPCHITIIALRKINNNSLMWSNIWTIFWICLFPHGVFNLFLCALYKIVSCFNFIFPRLLERLSIFHLFAIQCSSSVNSLFIFFAHFFIELFVFFLTICRNSLCPVDTDLLLVM